MRFFAVFLLLAIAFAEQSRVSQQGAHRMEIKLERFESGAWKAIDPALVLDKDDRIRFKFKANFSGFLYVTNLSTSATNSLLFPRIDTGSNNRVLAHREYRPHLQRRVPRRWSRWIRCRGVDDLPGGTGSARNASHRFHASGKHDAAMRRHSVQSARRMPRQLGGAASREKERQ